MLHTVDIGSIPFAPTCFSWTGRSMARIAVCHIAEAGSIPVQSASNRNVGLKAAII